MPVLVMKSFSSNSNIVIIPIELNKSTGTFAVAARALAASQARVLAMRAHVGAALSAKILTRFAHSVVAFDAFSYENHVLLLITAATAVNYLATLLIVSTEVVVIMILYHHLLLTSF